jgi:hypothetical protein
MKRVDILIGILALLLIGGALWYGVKHELADTGNATSFPHALTTPEGVTFGYGDSYGLALRPEQVLSRSYIPPCDENFDYCLYYVGAGYENTNFESAGIRMKNRPDLKETEQCLATRPAGYSAPAASTSMHSAYSVSAFGPLSDAATGHYSTGVLYRVAFGTTCYEFETRIGESQLANYPAGTKEEFTSVDRLAIESELKQILGSVRVLGAGVAFPDIALAVNTPPAVVATTTPATPQIPPVHSGIRGTLLVGPTCPVERDPPDPECADKPLVTSVAVYREGSGAPTVVGASDEKGAFEFTLTPDSYIVKAGGEALHPTCPPTKVAVIKDSYTAITISCDSGIR